MEGGMTVAALRPDATHSSVEVLLARIDGLARERQDLRVRHAATALLERNRLALVRCQWELSYALIARHLPPASERAA
jgi:hypothetical protein